MFKRLMKNEKGQALVEFALITPLLILLLCGIIDFGWIYGNQILLNNAGRDTARYMAIHYDTVGDDKDKAATDIMIDRLGDATRLEFDVVPTLIGVDPDERIKIYASYKLRVLTPVLSTILGDSYIRIHTDTTMRLE